MESPPQMLCLCSECHNEKFCLRLPLLLAPLICRTLASFYLRYLKNRLSKDVQSRNTFSFCSSGNRLAKLPNENGLPKPRSRLANSQFDYTVKNPNILDAKDPRVRLFLFQTHCDNHHPGVEHTRNTLQLHYWFFFLSRCSQAGNKCLSCLLASKTRRSSTPNGRSSPVQVSYR